MKTEWIDSRAILLCASLSFFIPFSHFINSCFLASAFISYRSVSLTAHSLKFTYFNAAVSLTHFHSINFISSFALRLITFIQLMFIPWFRSLCYRCSYWINSVNFTSYGSLFGHPLFRCFNFILIKYFTPYCYNINSTQLSSIHFSELIEWTLSEFPLISASLVAIRSLIALAARLSFTPSFHYITFGVAHSRVTTALFIR